MTTQRRQRLAFGIITIGLIGALAVAGLAIGQSPRPELVGIASPSSSASMSPSFDAPVSPSTAALALPSFGASVSPSSSASVSPSTAALALPSFGVSPVAVPAPSGASGATANRHSRSLQLIERVEPPTSLPAQPRLAVAPQPIAAPQRVEAAPAPAAAADLEVATTAHEALDVEITVSRLPDPPDVAASHQTETVRVPRRNDPWAPVRECESGGDYRINTGNGFYGAYQFTRSTWNWVAEIIGRDDLVGVSPQRAAPADQDLLANALAFEVAGGGLHHWPVCGRHYGG